LLDEEEKTEFLEYMPISSLFAVLGNFRRSGKILPHDDVSHIIKVYVECFKYSIAKEITLYLDFYKAPSIPLNLLLICVSNPHSFFDVVNEIMQSPDDSNKVIQAFYGRSYVN
jgi:hypothetical protein